MISAAHSVLASGADAEAIAAATAGGGFSVEIVADVASLRAAHW